ncbi:hypothetical protein OIE63_23095 [Streptomyces sp. NBC_01795]|uniref:hypothetical protein n=1 Tax=Streptomyces sp. NBC_01795 TaxID=2975943 RepID=UPI002DD84A2A|nr:hypothetical protein [Streptomyces sp. NBC_01795]WSA94143.1 hypothetical protein OIE63_23095 [Streptomyces sp. NBC_01795]
MTSTRSLVPQRGFYCECYINERRLGTFDAYSPHEALHWIRTSLTMITTALDEEPYRRARRWLDHDQEQAAQLLTEGRPHTLTLKQRTTQVTWTTRPVTYLPLHPSTTPAHQTRA